MPALDLPGYWALDEKPVPWEINCDNAWAWDGFTIPELGGYCNPGVLTEHSLNIQLPRDYYGALSSYSEGVMEGIEQREGVNPGRGVALMSCGSLGRTVWLRLPGHGWDGPFVAVDCSAPNHRFYHVIVYDLAVEIGWTAAQRLGVSGSERVDVHIGTRPIAWDGVRLRDWWLAFGLEWEDGFGIYGGPRGTATPTPP
jgi:hypothetical protein